MDWTLGALAVALLTVGLIGQAFEMRRLGKEYRVDDESSPDPAGVFADRRNFKWYAMIGAAIAVWFVAERL